MQDTTGEQSYRDFFHNHAIKEHILLELNKIISPFLLLWCISPFADFKVKKHDLSSEYNSITSHPIVPSWLYCYKTGEVTGLNCFPLQVSFHQNRTGVSFWFCCGFGIFFLFFFCWLVGWLVGWFGVFFRVQWDFNLLLN